MPPRKNVLAAMDKAFVDACRRWPDASSALQASYSSITDPESSVETLIEFSSPKPSFFELIVVPSDFDSDDLSSFDGIPRNFYPLNSATFVFPRFAAAKPPHPSSRCLYSCVNALLETLGTTIDVYNKDSIAKQSLVKTQARASLPLLVSYLAAL
jgi:hypothetical protein